MYHIHQWIPASAGMTVVVGMTKGTGMTKLRAVVYVSTLTALLSLFWQCNTTDTNQSVVAKVDQYTISESDYVDRYSNFLFSTGVEDNILARRQMIENMVNEILLTKIDDNDRILQDHEFINKKEQIWKEVLLAFYKEKEVYQKIQVYEEELRQEFARVNEQISARHLYARNKVEADRLYTQLMEGFSFYQLAPLVFEDEKLANNGGYLGYFGWGDMDPDFEEAAFTLKIGEISKPVRTACGYSIIKVEDRFRNPILTEDEFNRKKATLERLVRIRKSSQMTREITASLSEELNIRFEEAALKEMVEMFSGELGRRIIEGDTIKDDIPSGKTVLVSTAGSMTIDHAVEEIRKLPASNRSRIRSVEHLQAALRGIVVQRELIKDALDNDYDEEDRFLKKYENWVVVNLIEFKYRQIVEATKIPEAEILDYYEQHKKEFIREEHLKVQDILVMSEADANEIIDKINKGTDFTALAKKYSLRKDVKKTGGILGFVPLSRFGDFKDTFANAPVNQVIGPLKINNFYMIARVIEKEKERQLAFEEVREGIQETLKHEVKSRNIRNYLDDLRSKYTISIDEEMVANVPIYQ
ncbi:MAG: peptidylprolyl isomerase [Calditrichia bacterium]|nr:peptidylprolyl isomerase [Calditrichia bacterium]